MSIYIGCGSDRGDVFAIAFNCTNVQFTDYFIDSEAHIVPVVGMIVSEDYLISAGSNGNLQSYSIELKRKLYTFDNFHDSSITSISLSSDKNYLFTSADDGIIIIWKRSGSSWEKTKIIDKHRKSSIFCVHPSDKLAMSISKDNTFRVWNLYNGRQSHKIQIRQPFLNIKISPLGEYYALCTFNTVNIYEIEEAKLKCSFKTSGTIKDILFLNDLILCVAQLRKICFYRISENANEIHTIDLGEYSCKHLSVSEGLGVQYLICAIASSFKSIIKIFDVTFIQNTEKQAILLGSYEVCNLRITAMSTVYK